MKKILLITALLLTGCQQDELVKERAESSTPDASQPSEIEGAQEVTLTDEESDITGKEKEENGEEEANTEKEQGDKEKNIEKINQQLVSKLPQLEEKMASIDQYGDLITWFAADMLGDGVSEIYAIYRTKGERVSSTILIFEFKDGEWEQMLSEITMDLIYADQMLSHNFTGDSRQQVIIGGTDGGSLSALFFYIIGSRDGENVEILYDGYNEESYPQSTYEVEGNRLILTDEFNKVHEIYWDGEEFLKK